MFFVVVVDFSDLRLGAQYQTVDCNFKKIYKMNDQVFIGFNGLQSDAQTFSQLLQYEVNAYKLRENGCLADIIPTMIELMGMEQPAEMTGKSLLIK